jgi:alkyl sulfatase BDS1-like metallo-beta-lactamase superfamily hydrolase
MNDGRTVHELMAEITLPPELEVGEGYGKVSWGVRSIWEHYSGWFHHQSTTELLDVPRSAIDHDLVALAGADALVDRAEQRLAAGEIAEAIHLLDIVLDVEPDHAGAPTVAIAAHQALLADADNMWLERWLEHRIKRLDGQTTGKLGLR